VAGYTPIELPYSITWGLVLTIPTDIDVVSEFQKLKRGKIPEEEYTELERERIEVAKLLAERLEEIYDKPAPDIEIWNLPPRVTGEHRNRTVAISRDVVRGPLFGFLATLFHELTHHFTGAVNGTPKMIHDLGELAGFASTELVMDPELSEKIRKITKEIL